MSNEEKICKGCMFFEFGYCHVGGECIRKKNKINNGKKMNLYIEFQKGIFEIGDEIKVHCEEDILGKIVYKEDKLYLVKCDKAIDILGFQLHNGIVKTNTHEEDYVMKIGDFDKIKQNFNGTPMNERVEKSLYGVN